MTDYHEQPTLFDDPTIAAEERELFGDQIRPARPDLKGEGDYLHGWVKDVERNVDLKTGFAPVDIWTIEAISGLFTRGTARPQQGRLYALAALHVTLKNRLAELDPQPTDGERIAIRRGRAFISTVEGPSHGKELIAWQVAMPDRLDSSGTTGAKGAKK